MRRLLLIAALVCGCGRSAELPGEEPAEPQDLAVGTQPFVDLAPAADLSMAVAAALDLARAPDLSAALDLARAPDLSAALDLAIPPDLSPRDGAARLRDLSQRPDLTGETLAFGTPHTFTAGKPAGTGLGIAAGDFNNDSRADIAIANWGLNYTGSLAVLLGRGDGTLMPPSNFYAGGGPFQVTVADLDGDGNQDLVSSTVALWSFLGHGDGTWQSPGTSYAGAICTDAIVADLNNDGRLDVAAIVANPPAGVRVYLGVDGGLAPQREYLAGTEDSAGAIGTFSRAGARGIAVADRGLPTSGAPATLQVLMVQPDGTLGAATGYATHALAWDVVAADFNRDGVDDLAVAELSGGIGVYLANGDGTFAAESHFDGGAAHGIVAADFNADGIPDVATADSTDSTVSVRLGAGDGTFGARRTLAMPGAPNDLVAVDLDGDGLPDIATVNADATVTVVLTRPQPRGD
jgi:hypothetical protein